jgi:hypothetical protein
MAPAIKIANENNFLYCGEYAHPTIPDEIRYKWYKDVRNF